MRALRCSRALSLAVIASAVACGGSPASPSSTASTRDAASLAILNLAATVEPLTTTPQPGLVYRLSYQVHESNGRTGATLVTLHFTLSNGTSADGNFNTVLTPPHVVALGTITLQSTLSLYPATVPASHVTFLVNFTDDGGRSGTASAAADISRLAGTSAAPQ